MPYYIRAFVPGGTFFFTVGLLDVPAGEQLSPTAEEGRARNLGSAGSGSMSFVHLNLYNATGGMRSAFPPYDGAGKALMVESLP